MNEQQDSDLSAELHEHHKIEVDRGQAPLRVDRFLVNRLNHISRNRIQNTIVAGNVLVNGDPVKSNHKVKPLDKVSLVFAFPPREFEVVPEDIPLVICHEDEDIIVVNKKAGMVVHPAYGNHSGTLLNALLFHFQKDSLEPIKKGSAGKRKVDNYPFLAHRLDKNTSGLLVAAKNEIALAKLAKQFYERSVERSYMALVWGHVLDEEGVIEGHIGRNLGNRKIMAVFPHGDHGKHARTHFRVIKRFHYVTLVECRLETGRTHQIRIHFKHIGHPLFNDPDYGGDKIIKGPRFTKYKQFVENCFNLVAGQVLHAKSLGFIHPATQKKMSFTSEVPDGILALLGKWDTYRPNVG